MSTKPKDRVIAFRMPLKQFQELSSRDPHISANLLARSIVMKDLEKKSQEKKKSTKSVA